MVSTMRTGGQELVYSRVKSAASGVAAAQSVPTLRALRAGCDGGCGCAISGRAQVPADRQGAPGLP